MKWKISETENLSHTQQKITVSEGVLRFPGFIIYAYISLVQMILNTLIPKAKTQKKNVFRFRIWIRKNVARTSSSHQGDHSASKPSSHSSTHSEKIKRINRVDSSRRRRESRNQTNLVGFPIRNQRNIRDGGKSEWITCCERRCERERLRKNCSATPFIGPRFETLGPRSFPAVRCLRALCFYWSVIGFWPIIHFGSIICCWSLFQTMLSRGLVIFFILFYLRGKRQCLPYNHPSITTSDFPGTNESYDLKFRPKYFIWRN